MTGGGGAGGGWPYDYAAVGHVTVDVMPDGARRPGGTAFYSALQASRLGLRTAILTRGVAREIEQALGPHLPELELLVQPAGHTTTLATSGSGAERTQRVLAWAGPIAHRSDVSARIVHLAPVARELGAAWLDGRWLDAEPPRAGFVGLTPQGLVRDWSGPGESFVLAEPGAAPAVAARCRALVVSEHERSSCRAMIEDAVRAGASVAITAGALPTRVLVEGDTFELSVDEAPRALDDLGAGDVFAAAFYIALSDGRPPVEAAAYANAAAAVRVGGLGAQAVGDASAIEARLRGTAI